MSLALPSSSPREAALPALQSHHTSYARPVSYMPRGMLKPDFKISTPPHPRPPSSSSCARDSPKILSASTFSGIRLPKARRSTISADKHSPQTASPIITYQKPAVEDDMALISPKTIPQRPPPLPVRSATAPILPSHQSNPSRRTMPPALFAQHLVRVKTQPDVHEEEVVVVKEVPALPPRNALRVSRLFVSSSGVKLPETVSSPNLLLQAPATRHKVSISSGENMSFASDDDEYGPADNSNSPQLTCRENREDTARVVSVIYSGRPSIVTMRSSISTGPPTPTNAASMRKGSSTTAPSPWHASDAGSTACRQHERRPSSSPLVTALPPSTSALGLEPVSATFSVSSVSSPTSNAPFGSSTHSLSCPSLASSASPPPTSSSSSSCVSPTLPQQRQSHHQPAHPNRPTPSLTSDKKRPILRIDPLPAPSLITTTPTYRIEPDLDSTPLKSRKTPTSLLKLKAVSRKISLVKKRATNHLTPSSNLSSLASPSNESFREHSYASIGSLEPTIMESGAKEEEDAEQDGGEVVYTVPQGAVLTRQLVRQSSLPAHVCFTQQQHRPHTPTSPLNKSMTVDTSPEGSESGNGKAEKKGIFGLGGRQRKRGKK